MWGGSAMDLGKQIFPLNEVLRFQGPVSRVSDRRRIELCSSFKVLFQGLERKSDYVIEVALDRKFLFERLKERMLRSSSLASRNM